MTPEHKHVAGLELVKQQVSITSPLAAEQLDYLIAQAKAAPEHGEAPFAWAEFDGEGGHDLRLYENNEDYHQEYVKRNGDKYAGWVFPLYTVAAKPDADLIELLEHASMHMRQGVFAPFGTPATPQDRARVALCARIDDAIARLSALHK